MSLMSPEERELLESQAMALYEEAVMSGRLSRADPRFAAEDGPLHAALELLVKLGLLIRDGNSWHSVDPATVSSNVVAPMSAAGSSLLNESAEWARIFGDLSQTYRKAPIDSREPFLRIPFEQMEPFLNARVADATEELLTAQPTAGRNRAGLERAMKRDLAALDRGVKMRTLYQNSTRRSAMTHDYVSEVTQRGAEVRTLDEFFMRLIVIDRRLALIPSGSESGMALAIDEPGIVRYLADIFERHWERGRLFQDRNTTLNKEVSAEQRAMTIRMLIGGQSDPASAKRLGVSPRTYAMYIADLKNKYDAPTRFQLGYTMGKLGVDGTVVEVEEAAAKEQDPT